MTFYNHSPKPNTFRPGPAGYFLALSALLVLFGALVLPCAALAEEALDGQLSYDNGTRFNFSDESFARLNLTLQPRYSFISDDEVDDRSAFSIRRARVALSGQASEKVSYRLNAGFVDIEEHGERRPGLVDAHVTWNPLKNLAFRVGQFKTALSRQFGSSSHTLQFPERTLASKMTVSERRRGAGFLTSFSSGQVQLGGGIFNNYGARESNIPTNRHFYSANLRLNPMGLMNPHEEGDYGRTEEVAVSFGAAYGFSPSDSSNALQERHSASVDGNVKYKGYSLHTEFFWNRFAADALMDSASNPLGFYAQTGYFIVPRKLEAAVRYSYIDCDEATQIAASICSGEKGIHQPAASINYWFSRQLRTQLGYEFINRRGTAQRDSSLSTNTVVLQLNGYF